MSSEKSGHFISTLIRETMDGRLVQFRLAIIIIAIFIHPPKRAIENKRVCDYTQLSLIIVSQPYTQLRKLPQFSKNIPPEIPHI